MSIGLMIAIITGASIIAGLSYYAGRLLWQLKLHKANVLKKHTEQQAALAKSRQTRNAKLSDSINILARAMKEKQCEYSEGCLRVWVLISQYSFDTDILLEETYPGVFALFNVVKDMPTHDSRKKYTKKEIYKMDTTRWRAEEQYEAQIMKDCEKLASEFKSLPNSKNIVFQ